MWSSGGLGPPTYRPLEFPYDEYRGGMGEFSALGGGPTTSWGPTPPTNPIPTTAQDDRSNEDSVIFTNNIVQGDKRILAYISIYTYVCINVVYLK